MPGSVAQVDMVVEQLPQTQVLGQVAGRISPASATAWGSSKVTAMASRL